jgi:hypothetical protein
MRLSRELVLSYESAWSVARRIRRAMAGEQAEFCKRIAYAHNGPNGNGGPHNGNGQHES